MNNFPADLIVYDEMSSHVQLPPPYNRITDYELSQVSELLTAVFRQPQSCISKGQLRSVAETAIAKCSIAETRLLNLGVLLTIMGKAINGMADTHPARSMLLLYHTQLVAAINGQGVN